MVYAVVNNKIVENIVESNYAIKDGWIAVPFGAPVCIGDSYINQVFYDKNGNIRYTPEVGISNVRINDLETAFDSLMGGVSVALGL